MWILDRTLPCGFDTAGRRRTRHVRQARAAGSGEQGSRRADGNGRAHRRMGSGLSGGCGSPSSVIDGPTRKATRPDLRPTVATLT
jgi:hypothetical protein